MVTNIKGLIRRLFGREESGQALDEQQTESEARVGQIKKEFAEHPSKGLTPARLYQILESAEQGDLKAQHELFEDMEEKDTQIAADMGKRRQLAAELEWQIVAPDSPSAEEKKAADFCAEVFTGLEVEDLIIELASGIGHGWAMLELPWTTADNKKIVEQPVFRPHSWFKLNPDDQNELRLRDLSATGAALWPLGWVRHIHKAKAGYIARGGLHRVLAWPYLFQNYAVADLAELLTIYGIPARLGTYPTNATDMEKATLLRAVTSIGRTASGIIPQGMAIDFKEAADGKGDLFSVMIDWCERSKARAILGSTLTSGTGEGTNTNALGNVHERGQQSLIRSDVRQYAGTIGRDILWPMAAINFGIEDRRRSPHFFLDTGEAEDFELLSKALPVFVDLGAKVPVWWLHEKTRIPQAGTDEEVLTSGKGTDLKSVPEQSQAALRGRIAALTGSAPQPSATAADPSDSLAGSLAGSAMAVTDPWLERLRGLTEQASDLESLRDAIIGLYPELPPADLGAAIARATTLATCAGRVEVKDENG